MRTTCCVWVLLLLLAATASAVQGGAQGAAAGDQFVGTWSGSWEGAGGSGGFELTIEKGESAQICKVSVTGEPTYKATCKALSFEGQKMTAKYDFTPDESLEVVLGAAFDGKTVKGTWSARMKADNTEVASGTWTATKQ